MEADDMFVINPVLWDFYKQYDGVDGYKRSNGGWMGAKPEQIFVAEVPMADYTDAVRASYADAAIVVISRVGGEGSDMPTRSNTLPMTIRRTRRMCWTRAITTSPLATAPHDALNNVLALCGKTVEDGMDADGDAQKVYGWNNSAKKLLNTSVHTGEEVTNQFDDADLNDYGQECVYLTRADWTTFPTTYATLNANAKMLEMLDPMYTYNQAKASAKDVPTYSYGVDSQMTLAKMYGLAFDDPAWEKLLNQMTIEDQVRMVSAPAHTRAAV